MSSHITPELRREITAALDGNNPYETGRRHYVAGWTGDQVEECMDPKNERHVMEYWHGFFAAQRQMQTSGWMNLSVRACG